MPASTPIRATWTSFGECVSWYASHKDFVLGGATAPTTVTANMAAITKANAKSFLRCLNCEYFMMALLLFESSKTNT